jgi:hypothetical protein
MAAGKPAGLRCIQLTPDNRCLLFGLPERPAVCISYKASPDFCGSNCSEALDILEELEDATR